MIIYGRDKVFHLKKTQDIVDLTDTLYTKFERSTIFISDDILCEKVKFLFWENRILKLHIDASAQKIEFRTCKQARNRKFTCNLKLRVPHNRRKFIPPFTKGERRARTRAMNAWPRPYFYLCCYKDWSLVVFRSLSIASKPSIHKVKYFFVSMKSKLEFAKFQHYFYRSHLNIGP